MEAKQKTDDAERPDDAFKKEREERIKKRKEEEEKARSGPDEAKNKMEEMKKKREEAAKKKEEDLKKIKEEAEAKRRQSIADKKQAEEDAKQKLDPKASVADEDKSTSDDAYKKERDERIRKRKEDEEKKKSGQDEAKNKMEEMKRKRDEAAKKKEEDLKKAKEEAEAKRKQSIADKKQAEEDAKKQAEEANQKKLAEQDEAKNKMAEMKKKREEAAKQKEEDARKAKEDAEAKRKQSIADKKQAEEDAKKQAEEAKQKKLAETEAKKAADAEAKKQAEDAKKQADDKKASELEAKKQQEADLKAKTKAESEEEKSVEAKFTSKIKKVDERLTPADEPEVAQTISIKPPKPMPTLDPQQEAIEVENAKITLEKLKRRKKVVKTPTSTLKESVEEGGEERRTLDINLTSPGPEKKVSDVHTFPDVEKTSATVIEYQQEAEEVDKHVESIIRKAKHDREEIEESFAELDEVEEFLNQRRQRLQLDEIQVDNYMLKAIRHRQRRAGFVSLPESEILALRNDTVTVECELFNEEDTVSWLINGQPVSSEPRARIEDYAYIHRVVISGVVPADTGLVVSVTLGQQTFESALKVDETPVQFARKLDWKKTGIVGKDLVLSADLSHKADEADERIIWLHNGERISDSDPHYNMSFSGLTPKLELADITYQMAGRYSLQVDEVECSTMVEVHGRPIVAWPSESKCIELDAHDTIMFNLKMKALPEPEVELIFNGVTLPADIRTHTDVMENAAIVCRRQATKADRGQYRVRVFNEFGEDYQDFTVYVRDVPEAPSNLVINEIGHDYAVVAWTPPTDDGGSPITGYLVEKKGVHRRLFQRAGQVSSHTHELFVEDLDMVTEYVFHVAALNRFGVGEFSREAEICTGIPYTAPSMKSAPVICSTRDRSCRLEWDECTDLGGSPLYGYDVFVREKEAGSTTQWQKLNDETVFTNSYFVDGLLQTSKTYEFKVEACNQAGLHSNSNVVSDPLVVSGSYKKPSGKVSKPNIVVAGQDSVSVSWDEYDEDGVDDVSYTVQYKSEGGTVWNEVTTKYSPLNIKGLKEGVFYVFKVYAHNFAGVGETSEESVPIKVAASQKPTITKALKDVTVPKKKSSDGKEILPEEDTISISNEGFMSALRIHRISSIESGNYKCEVYNEHGTEQSMARIHVAAIRAHFVTSFAEHTQVYEHNNVVLECELSDPEAVVNWFKNKRQIHPETSTNPRLKIESIGCIRRLTIEKALQEDSGYYVCETADERSRSHCDVAVKAEEPHIQFSPQDTIVTSFGGKVVLTSTITKEVSSVKWLKNGYEIWQQSGKYLMYLEDHLATLEIYNFDEKDVGEFVVQLPSNNERSAPAHVSLEVPPKIQLSKEVKEQEEVVIYAGKDLHFEASLVGWPRPHFEGLHNEQFLKSLANIENYEEDCYVVKISSLGGQHTGRITLKASNQYGEDIKHFYLKVMEVPRPARALKAVNVGPTSAQLTWEGAAQQTGLPVEHYLVERKTAKHSRWRQVARIRPSEGATTFKYVTDELFADEIYVFRVFAVNDVGRSESSNVVDVVTPADDADYEDEDVISGMSSLGGDIPPLERPGKPSIRSDNVKVEVSWQAVDGALLYGVERRQKGEDMWLEIANTDRIKFVDRSVIEIYTYYYRIVAKLPGVTKSGPSEESDEIFVARRKRRSNSPPSISEDSQAAARPSKQQNQQNQQQYLSAGEESNSQASSLPSQSIQDSGIGIHSAESDDSRSSSRGDDQRTSSISIAHPLDQQPPVRMPAQKKVVKRPKKKVEFQQEGGAETSTEGTKLELLDGLSKLVSVEEGQSTQLVVQWKGAKANKVVWHKEGKQVDDLAVLTGEDRSVVNILAASKADQGDYTCTLAAGQEIKWIVHLDVTAATPLVCLQGEKVVVKKHGEGLKLTANISPSSSSTLQWSVNGQDLDTSSGQNASCTSTSTTATLTIRQLDSSFNGQLQLSVKSAEGGIATDSVELQIQGPPPPPSGPLEVVQEGSKKCILKWKAPSDSSSTGAPLLGYCVERRDTRKSSWTFVLRTKEMQAEVAEGLVANTSYLFRVAAENKFGTGQPLELAQPIQLDDGKQKGGDL
uniref:Titin n=1 Tax=Ditylenchus dipsaci TaxID=166011 RepID=A0A915ER06_9BILA